MDVPKEKGKKIDSQIQKCVFIRYIHNTTKIYWVWDPATGKCFNSANIVFDEDDIFKDQTPKEDGIEISQLLNSNDKCFDIDATDSYINAIYPGVNNINHVEDTQSMGADYPHTVGQNRSTRPRLILGEEIIDNSIVPPHLAVSSSINSNSSEKDSKTSDSNDTDSNSLKTFMSDCLPPLLNWEHSVFDKPILKNNIWDLINPVNLSSDKGVIGCKWVYKIKVNADGTSQYKARLVVKGFEQPPDVDYSETFAPVATFATLQMLIALSFTNDWEIDQMEIVTAFLYSSITKTIDMEQPDNYAHGSSICKFKKALYGLKQAPRAWYIDINTLLLSIGFHWSKQDHHLYILGSVLLLL